MSIFNDIRVMHDKFGVTKWVADNKEKPELLKAFLEFRIKSMMAEEWAELNEAFENKDSEEIIDGIIDLIVFGTTILDAFGVNGQEAWDRVYKANMAKEPGVKPGRPNPWGLPDMIKDPNTWIAPTHSDNTGIINKCFE